jgi:hypothetical protein
LDRSSAGIHDDRDLVELAEAQRLDKVTKEMHDLLYAALSAGEVDARRARVKALEREITPPKSGSSRADGDAERGFKRAGGRARPARRARAP